MSYTQVGNIMKYFPKTRCDLILSFLFEHTSPVMYLQSDFGYGRRISVICSFIVQLYLLYYIVYERGLLYFVREFVIDWILECAQVYIGQVYILLYRYRYIPRAWYDNMYNIHTRITYYNIYIYYIGTYLVYAPYTPNTYIVRLTKIYRHKRLEMRFVTTATHQGLECTLYYVNGALVSNVKILYYHYFLLLGRYHNHYYTRAFRRAGSNRWPRLQRVRVSCVLRGPCDQAKN